MGYGSINKTTIWKLIAVASVAGVCIGMLIAWVL